MRKEYQIRLYIVGVGLILWWYLLQFIMEV